MSIYTKLLEVQKEIGTIKKDSTNPFFKSKYFDINTLLAEVKPVLNKHGLVLLQGLGTMTEKIITLCTQIQDTADDTNVTFTCPIPSVDDPQKMGSAITYFRRYALQSLLALEAEDDDGNTESEQKKEKYTAPMPDASKPPFEDKKDKNFKI